jgi:hypothetical protein
MKQAAASSDTQWGIHHSARSAKAAQFFALATEGKSLLNFSQKAIRRFGIHTAKCIFFLRTEGKEK